MSSGLPILYGYWRSSCSYRVRIVLALKGVAYETQPVNLLKGGQSEDAYRAVNPLGAVPALVIDGHTLVQSTAIVEYLEETRGAPARALLPADAAGRAAVRAVCAAVSNDIQPLGNLKVGKAVAALFPDDAERGRREREAWGARWVAEGFVGLERLLARTAGAHAVGDAVTLADAFIVPQVYNARRAGVDLGPFPTLARVAAAAEALEPFAAAHPSKQPDATES